MKHSSNIFNNMQDKKATNSLTFLRKYMHLKIIEFEVLDCYCVKVVLINVCLCMYIPMHVCI